MDKNEIITLIRNAKTGHKRWVENATSLIKGFPLDKNQIPVNSTDCLFGQWYYSEGQCLKSIPVFKDIERYHDALHKNYREIFVLLFEEEIPSFFSRLFGLASKISAEKQLTAQEKLKTLEYQSQVIMKKLDELEDCIAELTDEQLDGFIYSKLD